MSIGFNFFLLAWNGAWLWGNLAFDGGPYAVAFSAFATGYSVACLLNSVDQLATGARPKAGLNMPGRLGAVEHATIAGKVEHS